MKDLDEEYYVACRSGEPGIVTLKPTPETTECFYVNTHQPSGASPLHFTNAFSREMAAAGEKEVITDVMFGGAVFMVSQRVHRLLAGFDIEKLQFYPAIYEGDNGVCHDFMFLIFDGTHGRDWYDRDRSIIDSTDIEPEDKPFIDKFSLDAEKMRDIPEEQRLMFRMTGIMNPCVFAHRRIVDLCHEHNVTGVRFIPVPDYVDGIECI